MTIKIQWLIKSFAIFCASFLLLAGAHSKEYIPPEFGVYKKRNLTTVFVDDGGPIVIPGRLEYIAPEAIGIDKDFLEVSKKSPEFAGAHISGDDQITIYVKKYSGQQLQSEGESVISSFPPQGKILLSFLDVFPKYAAISHNTKIEYVAHSFTDLLDWKNKSKRLIAEHTSESYSIGIDEVENKIVVRVSSESEKTIWKIRLIK